jgi:hypothetical protein
MTLKRILTVTLAALTGSAAAAALAVAPATAASDASQAATSENWAGYVAGGKTFSRVSGSWVQPSATCTSNTGYSAFWVGLGGASGQSDALEQVGTQSDCTSDGQTSYYAWYELVPQAPVKLNLPVKPGDRITGTVTVEGSNVTVTLSNATTGASVTKTLQTNQIDTSSAEWIAEAPSTCDGSGDCQPLPLADFKTVDFSNATATAGGHTGSISDSDWSEEAVQLAAGGSFDGYGPTATAYEQSGSAGAEPSTLSSDGSSFSVAWQNDGTSAGDTAGAGNGDGAAGGYGSSGYGHSGYGYSGGGYGGYGYGGDGGYGSGGYDGYGSGGYSYSGDGSAGYGAYMLVYG